MRRLIDSQQKELQKNLSCFLTSKTLNLFLFLLFGYKTLFQAKKTGTTLSIHHRRRRSRCCNVFLVDKILTRSYFSTHTHTPLPVNDTSSIIKPEKIPISPRKKRKNTNPTFLWLMKRNEFSCSPPPVKTMFPTMNVLRDIEVKVGYYLNLLLMFSPPKLSWTVSGIKKHF